MKYTNEYLNIVFGKADFHPSRGVLELKSTKARDDCTPRFRLVKREVFRTFTSHEGIH
jgi:hypothetical protein